MTRRQTLRLCFAALVGSFAAAALVGCGQSLAVRGEVSFGSVIGDYLPRVKGEVTYEAGDARDAGADARVCLRRAGLLDAACHRA